MKDGFMKPSFRQADQDFLQKLRTDVNQTVRQMEPGVKKQIRLKAILFPAAYIFTYVAALAGGSNRIVLYSCYLLLGVLLVCNFLNLIHEAVHGVLFKSKTLNRLYVYFFDLIGANSYIWKVRHIRLHHNYPNVNGWDSDIEQSPLARIFPDSVYLKLHRYQHIYLPLLYPLYLINWLLVRDFKDFFNKKRMVWKVTKIPAVEYVKLFVFKALFLFNMIVLPVLVLHISFGQALLAFLLMMFTASLISLMVLLSPHASVASDFPQPDEQGRLRDSWFMHQLLCTNDISNDNWFTRFFMGCFNYHIAHHLFPSVNHVYYPAITKVIRRFAQEHALPYRQFPIIDSLRNHYRLLKRNAFAENIFEETM